MTLNDRELRIIELTKRLVGAKVRALPEGRFCCGFLWGYVRVRRAQKNGKVREFDVKTCFGSFDPADWNAAMTAAATVPDVRITHVNPD